MDGERHFTIRSLRWPLAGPGAVPATDLQLDLGRVGPVPASASAAWTGTRYLDDGDWENDDPLATGAAPPATTARADESSRRDEIPPDRARLSPVPARSARVSPVPPARALPREIDRRHALALLAGYGEPPTSLLATPGYALRVLRRRRIVQEELAHARRHRSLDAPVYEEALESADAGALWWGTLLTMAMIGCALAAVWFLLRAT